MKKKTIFHAPFLYEDLHQKMNKCFSTDICIDITWNNLEEGDRDLVFEEIVID